MIVTSNQACTFLFSMGYRPSLKLLEIDEKAVIFPKNVLVNLNLKTGDGKSREKHQKYKGVTTNDSVSPVA